MPNAKSNVPLESTLYKGRGNVGEVKNVINSGLGNSLGHSKNT